MTTLIEWGDDLAIQLPPAALDVLQAGLGDTLYAHETPAGLLLTTDPDPASRGVLLSGRLMR